MNLRSVKFICIALAGCSTESPSLCEAGAAHHGQFALIPAGKVVATVTDNATRGAPLESIDLAPFEMQVHEVTNAQFSLFVSQTQYETDVERGVRQNNPNAGSALFVMPASDDSDRTFESSPSVGWQLAKRRHLESTGGARNRSARARILPGHSHFTERCQSLCRVGRCTAADGTGMGIRGKLRFIRWVK